MNVEVKTYSQLGVLAFVDGVRVRVITRGPTRLPAWRCDNHPTPGGRTSCPHIAALAATPIDPSKLARAHGTPLPQPKQRRQTR